MGSRHLVRPLLVLLLICAAGTTPASGGDFYVGAAAAADRLNVLYEKIVDNTDPQNFSLSQGQQLRDEASAAKFTYSYGFLAGYKLPLSVTGVYLALEGDMMRHGGIAVGRLAGTGTAAERNQLGQVWAEDWTFEKDTSYGLTGRLGAGLPLIGTWFGPSIYGLVGMRRLKAGFRTDYTGCVTEMACTEPSQFVSGFDAFDENFSGWTYGGGIEQKFGLISLRGEVRITDYSDAGRVIPFEDLFTVVPLDLQPRSVSFGLAAIFYF
jgi:opacity protein-like surface antigen